MQLLNDELREKLPPLYSGEEKGLDAVALVKFFTPDRSRRAWYVSEFDGKDTFFGLEVGNGAELAYFSLWELQEVWGTLGMPVEVDPHYTPKTLYDLIVQHRRLAVL